MTYRNDDDDTSAGTITQGGAAPRRGKSIWWVMIVAVIAIAVAIAVLSLPKKQSVVERGTAPVSTTLNATGPGVVGPGAAPTRSVPAIAPSVKP